MPSRKSMTAQPEETSRRPDNRTNSAAFIEGPFNLNDVEKMAYHGKEVTPGYAR